MTTPYKYLPQLTYCLDNGYPAEVIEVMLILAGDRWVNTNHLLTAFMVWEEWGHSDDSEFRDAVEEVTGETCLLCEGCGGMSWYDNTTAVASGEQMCDRGCMDNYQSCDDCGEYFHEHQVTYVSGYTYCDDNCLHENCSYCDDCDEYYRDNDGGHDHDDDDDEGCDCEAPHLRFQFPNDGHGTVAQNERLSVQLPKGTIDEEGILRITRLVQESINLLGATPDARQAARFIYYDVPTIIQNIGPLWQAKRGNFTRRLSAALYSAHHVKLAEGVISEVGNLARAHSSEQAAWLVEFTRHLNGSAEEFGHEDSCWFTGGHYGRSRCALKNWGGLGMRSYSNDSRESYDPDGRAWVQPLGAELTPTHDVLGARAYLVYNGYGDMQGYVAARIVAHLTSKTYRKVSLYASPQYINGNTAYLVADEATCTTTESITYEYDEHYQLDAATYKKAVA